MLSYTKIETYDEKVLIEILTFAPIFSLKKNAIDFSGHAHGEKGRTILLNVYPQASRHNVCHIPPMVIHLHK